MATISAKKLTQNVALSMMAQIIALMTSFVLGFIVPKFIPELQYGYWQTFVLYLGYVGILNFGLLDGIVLRYSQYDYEQLDKARIRSQFQILLGFTGIICISTCLIASFFLESVSLWIVVLVAIGIVTENVFMYTSYTFQLTNRIKYYALLIIGQKAAYAIFVIVLLIAKVNDFYWYCIADLFGSVVGIILASFFNKGLYFGKSLPFKEGIKETFANVGAGIFLVIATYSALLMMGGAKMVVQWRWDTLTFGKVAFGFSVSNLFLNFVRAISVVLFPSLKRMKEEELPDLYGKIRNVISPLLFLVMIAFFPMCWVLELWLPKYTESLAYLGVLLPIVIFHSKVSLLTNNYLKTYRKERVMLLINVICVVLGMAMFLICAYLLNDLDLLLYSVVLIILIRSIVSEIVVMKIIKRVNYFDFAIELIMTVIFVVAARYFSLWTGFLIYAVALAGYCILYRKNLAGIFRALKKKVKEKSGVINKE